MDGRLVIHGSSMGGYGLPGMLAFVGVIGSIPAFLMRIWVRPAALTEWLIPMGIALITLLAVEMVNRRNVVEVTGDRVRWSFRQPPKRGDALISNLKEVEVLRSGARLVFDSGVVFASYDVFRRRDIRRLVEGLQRLGAQVTEMSSPSR